MQTLAQIKEILERHGARPKRSLGQNFLIDHNLIRKLVDESGVSAGGLVLEVGPGTGTLSEELLERGCSVIASELDDLLASVLEERLGDHPGFALVRGDCLHGKRALNPDVDALLGDRPFWLVANLPYGAATPLMSTLCISHRTCLGLAVTVQKEVADRVLASPGSKDYGALSIIVQSQMRCRRVAALPPECFWPRPEVHSAMMVCTRLARPITENPVELAVFASRLFQSRRKQLGAILGRGTAWPEGVRATQRPEDLSVEQAILLCRAYREETAAE